MKITVFTPTYNRAHMLKSVFESLLRQTSKDFEWLLVDDGSTDNTKEMIQDFQQQADFPVVYVWKENGGKHTAYNLALEHARGRWFVCLDSDDMLVPDAIAQIVARLEAMPSAQGVVAYKADGRNANIGDFLPTNVESLHLWEIGIRYGCTGDYVFVYDTDIARKHPFPVFSGERFSPEGVVLDCLECNMVIVHQVLMICEYQIDGYTNNFATLMMKNPCGFSMVYMQRIDMPTGYIQRWMNAGKYHCFRKLGKKQVPQYQGDHKLLVFFAVALGALFRLYYKFVRKM